MRLWAAVFVTALLGVLWAGDSPELRFAMRSDPKTFDALVAADQASEMVTFLTTERLLFKNRKTQKIEPGLAESWKLQEQGRRVVLELRKGVQFSDGSPFTASDVAFTVRRLVDPKLNSPKSSAFRSGEAVAKVEVLTPHRVAITFPAIVPGIENELAGIPIQSERNREKAGLGPYVVAQYQAGSLIVLSRNPYYWRTEGGRRLPKIDTVRIAIQQNADTEAERFRRGEYHLLESVDPTLYERLERDLPGQAHDAGPSNDIEFLWFNQAPQAPVAPHKLTWFQSRSFRRAMSLAIRRDDIVRLVYQGRATVAAGLTPPGNKLWYKHGLKPHPFDFEAAKKLLQQDGFVLRGDNLLYDRQGKPVEFSLITNANNKARARIASLIQQDLGKLGIRVNITTFDFPSLVERIGRTLNYEACLLGFVNLAQDPMSGMNMLLSSGPQHMWNPNQKTPATAWEQEIDKAMREQASTTDAKKRKAAYDRVQQILSEEAPVLFLAHRNTLYAASPKLHHVLATNDYPRLLWNAEHLSWSDR
ncbi:ABC transporter substrate-binding protein [Bryobacterales bacterium F-183]|nr:ABC transporter substrate-binding protein [Bryobacterales bacterium F-183]